MARRISTTRTTRLACCAALVSAAIAAGPAFAQNAPPAATPLSKACQPGASADADQSPLPNVAAALAQRKALRILAFGAAPGRINARGGYTTLIENMLAHALKGVDVMMINRGVSGELAAGTASRMKNEVALEEPDLVLWPGRHQRRARRCAGRRIRRDCQGPDRLAEGAQGGRGAGLQFAKEMLRDAHYVEIRETLRKLAAQENVIVIRFFEAMQIINQAQQSGPEPVAEEFSRDEAGYNCLAQYVARALTLGVFAKSMPKRPMP
jgi:hypothetical protein